MTRLSYRAAREAGVFICGHPRDEANTYTQPSTGQELCRTCRRGYAHDYRRKSGDKQKWLEAARRVAEGGEAW